ncbi:hypothetical protein COY62_02720 [bacterium (Candidatus Howlettbacteria) CG_4_10_14_0_8_um_filter_40_9]|nr:MAG: hypothetical protein COY62_02720 [bacterium (Candidatus Howlettbacteria) CG_4_10_14_0_8_um_filter_40_9]
MADNEKQSKFTPGMMHTSSIAKAFGAISGQLPSKLKDAVVSAEKDMSGKMDQGITSFDEGDKVSGSSQEQLSVAGKELDKYPEYAGFKTDTQKINRKRSGSDGEIQKPVSTIVVKGGAKANVRPPEGPGLTEAEMRTAQGLALVPPVVEAVGGHAGGEDKPKKRSKGQKNFDGRFGILDATNQKLADAGENHEDRVQEFYNLDSDAAHKYGVIKGKRRTTLGGRTSEPVITSYNPKTGEITAGRTAFDGGKKIEPKKEPDKISEPTPVDHGEEFIGDQIGELEVIFKSKGEEALAKELMRRGFAQEREKNGKLFPGVKTGAEEIFEACKEMARGETKTDRTKNKKEGAEKKDSGDAPDKNEKELTASFIGEISSADSVKQVLALVERAGQKLGRHDSGIMKAAEKKVALLGVKANNMDRKNNKGDNMGKEGAAPVPAEAANFDAHAKGQDQPNNENIKPYTPISEYSPEDIKAMAEEENMTEDETREAIIRQNKQSAQFVAHGATAKETANGATFELTDKQLDRLIDEAKGKAEKDGVSIKLDDGQSPEQPEGGEAFDITKKSAEELSAELRKLISKDRSLDLGTEEGKEHHQELWMLIASIQGEIDQRGKGDAGKGKEGNAGEAKEGEGGEDSVPVFEIKDPLTPEEKAQARAEKAERDKKEGGEKNVQDLNKELMILIDEDINLDRETEEGENRHQELRIQIKALMKEIDDLENGGERKKKEEEENGEEKAETQPNIEIPQEIIDARTAYLKALEGARKWFRRTSPEEIKALRETYDKTLVEFAGKEQADRIRAEFPELEGEELEAKINETSCTLVVQEILERSNAEVELASDGPFKRVGNWLKRHPKTRFVAGLALTGAGFAVGGVGGAIGARALWTGVNTAIAAEGALDATGGAMAKKWGRLKGVSEEDAALLSTFGIDEKLADQLAFSLRRGESVQDNETVKNLLAERARDLQNEISRGAEEGKSSDVIRAEFLEKSFDETNIAIEGAQQEERKRSIKRWIAGATIGAIAGGVTAYLGYNAAAHHGAEAPSGTHHAPVHGGEAVPHAPIESAPVPTQDELINGFVSEQVAGPGDGEWDLAARAARGLADKMGMTLDKDQVASAVQHLYGPNLSHDMPGRMSGYLGTVRHFIYQGTSRVYSGPEIMEALKHGIANPAVNSLPSRSW